MKLRFDEEAETSLPWSLSGFIAKHIEHPASRHSNPASVKISCSPSCSASFLTSAEPGTTSARGLPLTIPLQDRNARLSVSSVDATFEVQKADVETTLPSIPVAVTFAPGIDWKKYDIQHEPTLTNVTVTGPADKIKGIMEGTLPVKARFEVSEDKVTSGAEKQRAPVQYDLPDGVKVKPDDAKKQIEFTLKQVE